MDSSDDSEYEEEILVYADFKNNLDPNDFSDPNLAIKIIGIESKNPIAEINGNIFKGSYDHSMGTHVFFAKDDTVCSTDPLYDKVPKQKYKYCAKTNKVLTFERIFVENQNDTEANSCESEGLTETLPMSDSATAIDSNQKESNLKTNLSYEDALKLIPTKIDSN